MDVYEWTADQVVQWLTGLPLPVVNEISASFLASKVNGDCLLHLDHAKLTDLDVSALGHREVLLGCIKRLASASDDHHSDQCFALCADVISLSTKLHLQLSRTQQRLPVPDLGSSKPPSSVSNRSGIGALVIQLMEATRSLVLWLDRNPVSDYVDDFDDFRDLMLRSALFLASMHKDSSTEVNDLHEKCDSLGSLATSLHECLKNTSLGLVRPTPIKVTLPPAENHPKGWGFSVRCSSGLAYVNAILENTPAALCESLRPKDELAEVDGIVVTSWAFENITQLLRDASKEKPLELVVMRGTVLASMAQSSADDAATGGGSARTRLVPSCLKSAKVLAVSRDSLVKEVGLVERPTHRSFSVSAIVPMTQAAAASPVSAHQRMASDADHGNDDDSSSGGSDVDSGTDQATARRSNGKATGSPLSVCVSDRAVPALNEPEFGVVKSRSSESSGGASVGAITSQPAAFGYRTQIIGGVVMRIPVSQNGEAAKSEKSSRRSVKGKFSLRGKSKKKEVNNEFQGFGSADVAKMESKSSLDLEKAKPSSVPLNNPGKSSPLLGSCGRAQSLGVISTRAQTRRLSGVELGHLAENETMSSGSLSGRGSKKQSPNLASRIFDRDNLGGDCDVPVSALKNPECEGWMTKQGNVKKNWKRRWFVLKDFYLYYYKSQSASQALNAIPVLSYTVQWGPEVREGGGSTLRLVRKNSRTFLMYCDVLEETRMWFDALTAACRGEAHLPPSSASSTRSGVVTVPTDPSTADVERLRALSSAEGVVTESSQL